MGRQRVVLGTLALLALVASGAAASASLALSSQKRSLNDGVYTAKQAERGSRLWRRTCAECHQPNEFVGYLHGYVGMPVSFLFDSIRAQMPQNNPGSLSRKQYADVLAYVFEMNGLPVGEADMDSDADSLDQITIEVASEGNGG